MNRAVDAHHHFWRTAEQEQPWRGPEHGRIARDFLPEDLAAQLTEAGIAQTVLVQSVDTPEENDRLHEFASRVPTVSGTVGYLPLRDPGAAEAELERADTTWWRGVRCLVAREPLHWLAKDEVRALFRVLADRGLVWDVVPVTSEQAEAVATLSAAVPDLRIVIDHLARPELYTGAWEEWEQRVKVLARSPRIALKISVGIDVLTTWSRWEIDDLSSYVKAAIQHFGPGRLMLASNWPIVELATSYRQAMEDLTALVAEHVRGSSLDEIRGVAATRWYGLDRQTHSEARGNDATSQ